jgi:hypothetical protein
MIKVLAANLVKLLISKKMITWALRFLAKQTDNEIDDSVVLLVDGAMQSDESKIQLAVETLAHEWKTRDKG